MFLKATKVDGVYDSDPSKNPTARRYNKLTYRCAWGGSAHGASSIGGREEAPDAPEPPMPQAEGRRGPGIGREGGVA